MGREREERNAKGREGGGRERRELKIEFWVMVLFSV